MNARISKNWIILRRCATFDFRLMLAHDLNSKYLHIQEILKARMYICLTVMYLSCKTRRLFQFLYLSCCICVYMFLKKIQKTPLNYCNKILKFCFFGGIPMKHFTLFTIMAKQLL